MPCRERFKYWKDNKSLRLWYTFIELRSSDCYPQTITYSLCVSLLAAGRALVASRQGSAVLLNGLNICGLGVGLFIVKNRNLHKFRNPSAKGTTLKLVQDCCYTMDTTTKPCKLIVGYATTALATIPSSHPSYIASLRHAPCMIVHRHLHCIIVSLQDYNAIIQNKDLRLTSTSQKTTEP